MKKPQISVLIIITLLFVAFTLGFFLGRNQKKDQLTVSVPAKMLTSPTETTQMPETMPEETTAISFPININTAGKEELMALPGIGEVLALRILSYREEYGTFSAPEELMLVEGIGEKRMEEILDLIMIGG